MTQNYKLDSHKLTYHPERVAQWYAGKSIFPIFVELSPVNNCNYRCEFCAFDYTRYGGNFLPMELLSGLIEDLGANGVKSIVIAGTGEPLMNKHIPEAIRLAFSKGLDVGLSTNGYFMNEDMADAILPYLTWIRFSFNAGSPETYSQIHGCKPAAFSRVVSHINACVEIKRRKGLSVTIGVQSLMLKKNREEFLKMANLFKTAGVDYFSLKPFSPHPSSINDQHDPNLLRIEPAVLEALDQLSTPDFQVNVRKNAICSLQSGKKKYGRCLGLPFTSYIESDGNVYACNTFVGDPDTVYGNLYHASFKEIWNSEKKQDVMRKLSRMQHGKCRNACRMDSINEYLWDIKHPPPHVNFI